MKKLLSICFLLATISTLQAQSWMTLGSGLSPQQNFQKGMVSTYYNGNLYVAEKITSTSPYQIRVSIWDGSSWTALPIYSSTTYLTGPRSIAGFQGDIYVEVSGDLLKYNGNNWSTVTIPQNQQVVTMSVINNKLVVTGRFTPQGTNTLAAEFDGNTWNVLPTIGLGITSSLNFGIELFSVNNELYLQTYEDSLNNISTNLFRFNTNTNAWEYAISYFALPGATQLTFRSIITNGQELYAQGGSFNNNKIYKIENDSAKLAYSGSNNFYISDHVWHNGMYYLTGNFQANQHSMATFDGQNLTSLTNTPTTTNWPLSTISSDGNLLYVGGNFTSFNGVTYNSIMASTGNYASLTGKVYADRNSDCQRNSGEEGLSGVILNINPGNYTVSTNLSGTYSLGVTAGTYSISAVNLSSITHQNLSPGSCNPAALAVAVNQTTSHNVAAQFNTTGPDLATSLSSFSAWRARFGFDTHYILKVVNSGSQTSAAGTINLNIPAGLQLLSSFPSPSAQSGSTISYSIPALNSFEEALILFTINMDTSVVSMGDSLIYTASINVSGDINNGNDSVVLGQKVVAAFDPNDKTASASKVAPGTDRLEYVIRFQNTGTDTAFTVTVRDTINAELKLNELEMISASHSYELRIKGNVVEWIFNNILLPDSSVDLKGSQGYIHFALGVDPTLALGSEINNDAEIYFDFQKPVHTNHAITIIEESIGLKEISIASELNIYPNPASDQLNIENKSEKLQELRLISTDGRILESFDIDPAQSKVLQLGKYPAGIYFLRSSVKSYRILLQ